MSNEPVDTMIASYLRDGPTELPADRRVAIAAATEQLGQRRRVLPVPSRQLLRAAAIVVAVALTATLLGPRLGDLVRVGDAPAVTDAHAVTDRPDRPSVDRGSSWVPGRENVPYPAPLREEPSETIVVPVQLVDVDRGDPGMPPARMWAYEDPTEQGSSEVAIVDIESVKFYRGSCYVANICIYFKPAENPTRPMPHPRDEWVVWGVVFDNDGDGRGDARFGIDNLPKGAVRAWLTDLRADTTEVVVGGEGLTIDHAGRWEGEAPFADTSLDEHGYAWVTKALTGPAGRFYVWAAAIRDGQIASLDFAPDVGWIDGTLVQPEE
jgi:hypothetical protein